VNGRNGPATVSSLFHTPVRRTNAVSASKADGQNRNRAHNTTHRSIPRLDTGRARAAGGCKSCPMVNSRSNGFKFAICKPPHLQQQPAVAKARDLRFTEGARPVVCTRAPAFLWAVSMEGVDDKLPLLAEEFCVVNSPIIRLAGLDERGFLNVFRLVWPERLKLAELDRFRCFRTS
jgi:hypothetical protein